MLTIKGITDEIHGCDCCGRSDLKRTVVLVNDDKDVVHYGTACAARAMGGRRTAKSVERKAVEVQAECDRIEQEAAFWRQLFADRARFDEIIRQGIASGMGHTRDSQIKMIERNAAEVGVKLPEDFRR